MGDEYKIQTYFTHPWIFKNSTDGRTALLAKFNDHTGPIFEAGDFEVDPQKKSPRVEIIDGNYFCILHCLQKFITMCRYNDRDNFIFPFIEFF